MKKKQSKRSAWMRQRHLNRVLMIVFAAVLFVGLFSQVTMLSRLSAQAKAGRAVEEEIKNLSANRDNLKRSVNQFKSPERIRRLALGLGMQEPDGSQLRVVSLPAALENTSTQSAGNVGVEEMQ